MRQRVFMVFALLLFAGVAAAQIPTAGNVYFGYSYYNTDLAPNRSGLNGWQGTLEGKLVPFLGIVADISGHYGNTDLGVICPVQPAGGGSGGCATFNVSTHLYEVMFGPRLSVSFGKFRPFGEFEVGVGHVTGNSFNSATTYATALGGGLDYRLFRPIAWRVQGDYVHTHFFSTGQNNVRISTGIVLRF